MIEFLFGVISGVFIVTPAILIALLFSFPCAVRHGKKPTTPTNIPPKSHISPYLYRLFPHTQEEITKNDPIIKQTSDESQLPQQQPTPPTLLESTRNDLLTQLNTSGKDNSVGTSGESLNWLNLIIVTVFSILKDVLFQSDNAIITTCTKNGLPLSGTYDVDIIAPKQQQQQQQHGNTTSQAKPTPQTVFGTPIAAQSLASSGSSTLLPILNRLLTQVLQTIPFIGPTRVTYLDIRSILPQINHIKIVHLDIPSNTLIMDIGMAITTDSTVEIDLSADLQYENLLIATMPAQVALANVHGTVNIRVAIDPGDITDDIIPNNNTTSTNNNSNDDGNDQPASPSISISLVEPPIFRFDLATSLGNSYWLTNLPFLHTLIHKAVMVGSASVLAPNCHTIDLPPTIYTDIVSTLVNLATGTKKTQ